MADVMDLSIAPEQYRLVGETAPMQVALGLCALGVLGSVMTAWLLLAEPQAPMPINGESSEQTDREKAAPASPPGVSMERTSATRPEAVEPVTAVGIERSPPVKATSDAIPTPAAAPDSSATEAVRIAATGAARPVEPDSATPPMLSVDNKPGAEDNGAAEADATGHETPAAGVRLCPPLFTVLFAHNSARPIVPPDFEEHLVSLREWMNAHLDAKLLFEGHADSNGSSEFNLRLSARRAMAVARLAVKAGISGERLAARAYGKSELLPGETADSASNRRVTMRIEQARQCPDHLD